MIVNAKRNKDIPNTNTDALKQTAPFRADDKRIKRLLASYFILSFVAVQLDYTNYPSIIAIANMVAEYIPSITGIALIAPKPDAAKVILSMTWLSIIPAYIYLLSIIPHRTVNFAKIKHKTIKLAIFIMSFVGLFKALMVIVPSYDNKGAINMIMYYLISSNTYLVSLYALCIIVVLVSLLLSISVYVINLILDKK